MDYTTIRPTNHWLKIVKPKSNEELYVPRSCIEQFVSFENNYKKGFSYKCICKRYIVKLDRGKFLLKGRC